MPADARDGILRGMYLLRDAGPADEKTPRVQLFGSGAILREVMAAADLLANEWNVRSDVWSVTSFNELQRDGVAAQPLEHAASARNRRAARSSRSGWANVRGPASPRPTTFARSPSRFTRSSDRRYVTLGTDGYGRSDFRRKLREFFEVDRHFVTLAALHALADEGSDSAGDGRRRRSRSTTSIRINPIRSRYRRTQ